MHIKHSVLFAWLLIAIASAGCSETNVPAEPTQLVIEGWIDSDGYPTVLLTASASAGTDEITIADKVIRWGRISISDGDTTIIMTGAPNKNYFPPYSYYTFAMKGIPGRTYTIEASYENLCAYASAKMPHPPTVDSVVTERISASDTLRAATIYMTAPDDCPAYYHLSTRIMGMDARHYPAILGCAKAEIPGEKVIMPIYRGKTSISTDDFVPQLPIGRNISVKVERVTSEVYDFWNAFNEASLFGSSQFVSAGTSLPSNIEGGQGVWSPQGSVIINIDSVMP